MKVHGIVWAGTKTDRFEETLAFFRDVLGIEFSLLGPHFAFSRMPNTSQLELFGPLEREHDAFNTGPVPEFLVDDLVGGIEELRATGTEILGTPHLEGGQGWVHFRAPDGNVYGLTNGPQYRR